MTIRITPAQLGPELRKLMRRHKKIAVDAAYDAALLGTVLAVGETDKQSLVDLSQYKQSWEAKRLPGIGAEWGNTAPYSSVIEYGRRPGRAGPPLKPIKDWVKRKLVANGSVDAKEADSVAAAIRWKIHHHGSKPRFVLKSTVPKVREHYIKTVQRKLEKGRK